LCATALAGLLTATGERPSDRSAAGEGGEARGTLKDIAHAKGLVFGSAAVPDDLSWPEYRQILQADCAVVTPELDLLLNRIVPAYGVYNFERTDAAMNLLRRLNLGVFGPTLIWQDYLRPWMKSLSKSECARLMDDYIERMVSRYAGQVLTWNVVNEPCFFWKGSLDGLRPGPFSEALGPSYIEKAFKRARAVDPHTPLVLNEAFTERGDPVGQFTRKRLLRLIDELPDAGTPIQAIGLQGHLRPQFGVDLDGYAELLEALERRRLDIHITELDVEDVTFPRDVAERDAKVAETYKAFLDVALRTERLRHLATWGVCDRLSFYNRADFAKKPGWASRPFLLDEQLTRKKAWYAVHEALQRMPARR